MTHGLSRDMLYGLPRVGRRIQETQLWPPESTVNAMLKRDYRISRINRELQLIIPVEDGHLELPLRSNVELASK